jgi:ribosomal protein S18 acetylase RimI-like enzyme
METLIKEMEEGQISSVVAVHLESFQGFFLSFLGPAFLRELYSSMLEDKDGICLVALDHDKVVGFVAGTTRSSGVYSRLLRQRLIRFCAAAVPAVLKRPSILPRLFRGITDPHGEPASDLNRGTLMSIAVLPAEQGKGIGQKLVGAFLEKVSLEGIGQVDLTTDKENNEDANLFYRQLGFRMERTFTTREGRVMNQYLIDLS